MVLFDVTYQDTDIIDMPESWKGSEQEWVEDILRAKHADHFKTIKILDVQCRGCKEAPTDTAGMCSWVGETPSGDFLYCYVRLCHFHAPQKRCHRHAQAKKRGRRKASPGGA